MTDDRSLERAARSWIEVGPTAAPPHVVDTALDLIERTPQERDWIPWRFPRMSNSARVMALIAIGALILAGAFAFVGVGGRGGPLPSTAPSASAVASAAAGPSNLTLSETFVSPTYGYTVKIPVGWSTKPATKIWSTGTANFWNSGFNDELSLVTAGMRFSGASQSLAEGQTADQWLTAYGGGSSRSAWLEIPIGGQTGYLTANGVAAAGGTISPGGLMFDAVVVSGDRAYNFNMDGKVDRGSFDSIVATITLDPSTAIIPDRTPISRPSAGIDETRAKAVAEEFQRRLNDGDVEAAADLVWPGAKIGGSYTFSRDDVVAMLRTTCGADHLGTWNEGRNVVHWDMKLTSRPGYVCPEDGQKVETKFLVENGLIVEYRPIHKRF